MRKGGGKVKGSGFERELCKELSLWVSHGKRDDLFWRSAMSGGRASVKFKKGEKNKTQVGDISAIDPLGHRLTDHVLIELKFYKDLELTSFIIKGTGVTADFWKTACEQARLCDKSPMLILKQNNYPAVVFVTHQCPFVPDDHEIAFVEAKPRNVWAYLLSDILATKFVKLK